MSKNNLRHILISLGMVICFASHASALHITIEAPQPQRPILPDLAGWAMGGNTHTLQKTEVMRALQGLPIPLIRIESVPGGFEGMAKSDGRFDWKSFDREIDSADTRGANIIINLFYFPEWLGCKEGQEPPQFCGAQGRQEEWAKIVQNIVQHVYAKPHHSTPLWEFWNEPTNPTFFHPNLWNKEIFWEYFAITAQAVKSVNPSAPFGGVGENATVDSFWDLFFKQVKQRHIPLDFISAHWYANWFEDSAAAPQNLVNSLQRIQNKGKQALGKKFPLYLTEWGHHTDKPGESQEALSAWLLSALVAMQDSPLKGACFFRMEPWLTDGPTSQTAMLGTKQWGSVARLFALYAQMPSTGFTTISKYPHELQAISSISNSNISNDSSVILLSNMKGGISDIDVYIPTVQKAHRWKAVLRRLDGAAPIPAQGLPTPVSIGIQQDRQGAHIFIPAARMGIFQIILTRVL